MLGNETKLDNCSIATVFIQSFQSDKDFAEEAMKKNLGFFELSEKQRISKFKEMYKFANPNPKPTTKK
jgi:hypothetical protein